MPTLETNVSARLKIHEHKEFWYLIRLWTGTCGERHSDNERRAAARTVDELIAKFVKEAFELGRDHAVEVDNGC